jgi:hypothetical protein
MADDKAVNSQITDAVTQANVRVLADLPAKAAGQIFQLYANAVALGAMNAVLAQQQSASILQATTTQWVKLLFNIDTATDAVGGSPDKP